MRCKSKLQWDTTLCSSKMPSKEKNGREGEGKRRAWKQGEEEEKKVKINKER